jgi:hypothetical protein
MKSLRPLLVAEIILAFGVVASLASVASFLHAAGYLPPPFFYAVEDTFMDWYNPAYWSNNPGTYDVWQSIYPPLSFVFLKIFSLHSCYSEDSIFARDCDWLGRLTLLSFFLLNMLIVFKSYRLADPRTAAPRSVAMVIGLPMIFAMDRGNLIIPSFTFFALGHGRLLRSARLRWIALALSVNFKPYLVATLIPQIVRRRWRWFEGCALACGLVYLVSFAIMGVGTPMEIFANITAYSEKSAGSYLDNAFYGASYVDIVGLISSDFPLMHWTGSKTMDLLAIGLPTLIRLGQAGVLLSFVATFLRPGAATTYRLAALSTALVLSSVEVGGYAQVYLIFLVFFERGKTAGSIVALVCAYLLCLSIDQQIIPFAHEVRNSYITNRAVGFNLGINAGSLVRPGILLLVEYGLIAATLSDFLRASPRSSGARTLEFARANPI